MKKKNIIILSASLLSAMAVGAGIVGIAPKAAEVKAEGKTEVPFNITTNCAVGEYTIKFNVDQTMPAFATTPSFTWLIDGVETTMPVYQGEEDANTKTLSFAWNGHYPTDTGYHHFRIDAGTVVYEDDTTKYVLEKAYNFWQARHSGGNDTATWVWQHGDSADIPSFSVEDSVSGGPQASFNRWLLTANYTKSDGWSVVDGGLWNCCQYLYATGDSTAYSLRYNTSDKHYCELANAEGGLAGSTSLTGSEHFILYFEGFDTTTGGDQFVSFYFPRGTLFGGLNDGYRCFLENDYYITVLNGRVFGTTKSTAELIYTPVQSFIDTNMKMGDTAYDGTGTGSCKGDVYNAAKTAYNTLSDNQKFAFCNYDGYADEKARLLAWAAANGDTLDASNAIVEKKSSSLLIGASSRGSDVYVAAVCAGALALVGVGACFVFRKKRED